MTKLIGVLLVLVAACVSAAAQQENRVSSDAVPAATKTNQVAGIQPQVRSVIESPDTPFKIKDPRRVSVPPAGSVIAETKWVFKDGAVYIDILGTGSLIPLPGGGASGCFKLDLEERIAKLRPTVEALRPPK